MTDRRDLGLLWEQVTDLPRVVSSQRGFIRLAISLGRSPFPDAFWKQDQKRPGYVTYLRLRVCVNLKPHVLMCQANIVELY